MAFRTWAKLLGTTLGVAALAGACQLGLAYGLGILRLTRVVEVAARDQWTAQLAWVAWFAMMAAVTGALAGGRLRDRWRTPASAGTFAALSVAAGVGAALVVPLTMQPARTARIDGVHPVFVIGLCAALGAAVGVFAAYAALTQTIARVSLTAVGIAIWVVALVSVAPSLSPEDPLPSVRLGVFDAGFLSPAVTQRTALFTMPALALITGAILGYAARRRDLPTLTIALAGLPGPALLTLAYLIAGPGAGADRFQVVPYWAAMTATGAGVLGSVLAAVIRRGTDPDDEPPAETATRTSSDTAAPASGGAAASFRGGADDEPTAGIPVQQPSAAAPVFSAGPSETAVSEMSDSRDQPTGDLPTFDAFARPSRGRSRGRSDETTTPGRRGRHTPAAEPAPPPYVPAPALPEIPPEALQPQFRPVNVDARPEVLHRGEPLTPEPHAISSPLPHPEPATPPLPIKRAPEKAEKRGRRQEKEDDFVDWVSKLGNE